MKPGEKNIRCSLFLDRKFSFHQNISDILAHQPYHTPNQCLLGECDDPPHPITHPSRDSFASPAGFLAIAMKSAIICEQWEFEYSAPPSQQGTGKGSLGRVKTSLGQRQPCPQARIGPALGLEARCPAGLIGLTDHRSADRYPHPSCQSRAPFHFCTM